MPPTPPYHPKSTSPQLTLPTAPNSQLPSLNPPPTFGPLLPGGGGGRV